MSARAVFLDRDGVINRAVVKHGRPYPPASLDELEIIAGVPAALEALRTAGFRLVVVTNQPDVGRGRTPRQDVEAINTHLLNSLFLDEIRTCFHAGTEGCDCRKPRPGLLLAAARDHGIDLGVSFMVGDRWRDMDAGTAAGCRTVLVDAGYDEQPPQVPPAHVCHSLAEAAQWILLTSGERP